MNDVAFQVTASTGSYRSGRDGALATLPHRWTRAGVEVHGEFTGAHMLHLAVASGVLDNVYREAESLAVTVHGARVRAAGGFDETWASTGIVYAVDVDSPDDPAAVTALLARVDDVAEIPQALRHATTVSRAPN